MAQFLCENFNEIHFIDPRYTKIDYEQYIAENQITDVLFLYNLSSFCKYSTL